MEIYKLFVCLSLLIFPAAHAQEAEKESSKGIQIRGFAFEYFGGIVSLELRSEEKILGQLKLPTGQLKQRISVPKRQFKYGVLAANEEFKTMGLVKLPDIGRDFILVFVPTKKGYKVFPLRTDDPEFKGNDAYLFNFSSRFLGILLGTSKQTVKPMETVRLRPSYPDEATFYRALFTYEKEGEFRPFSNTRWPVNQNTKALIFVFENSSTGKVSYRSVTELAR
jgi:hypothetical protein